MWKTLQGSQCCQWQFERGVPLGPIASLLPHSPFSTASFSEPLGYQVLNLPQRATWSFLQLGSVHCHVGSLVPHESPLTFWPNLSTDSHRQSMRSDAHEVRAVSAIILVSPFSLIGAQVPLAKNNQYLQCILNNTNKCLEMESVHKFYKKNLLWLQFFLLYIYKKCFACKYMWLRHTCE